MSKCKVFCPGCEDCIKEQEKQFREVLRFLRTHFPIGVKIVKRQLQIVKEWEGDAWGGEK